MATYQELADLLENNQGLRSKVEVATVVKAESIFAEASPSAARLTWAQETLDQPRSRGLQFLAYVLAANKDASSAAIVGASDAAIQANVDAAVEKIVGP